MTRSPPITILARKAPSFISIAADTTDGEIPLLVTVSGRLTDRQSRGLPARLIRLYVNSLLTGITTATDSGGYYALQVTFDEPGTYIVETEFPGDSRYLGCAEETPFSTTPLAVNPLVLVPIAAVVAWLLLK